MKIGCESNSGRNVNLLNMTHMKSVKLSSCLLMHRSVNELEKLRPTKFSYGSILQGNKVEMDWYMFWSMHGLILRVLHQGHYGESKTTRPKFTPPPTKGHPYYITQSLPTTHCAAMSFYRQFPYIYIRALSRSFCRPSQRFLHQRTFDRSQFQRHNNS